MDKELNKPSSVIHLIRELKKREVSDKILKRAFDQYIEDKARENRIPIIGKFELTPICNLDCKMCYVHLDAKQFNSNCLLSTETWKSLMKQAHKAGMIKAALTGGECLTYPGFKEVYLHLRDMGIKPSIMTNGLLLDKGYLDFFKRYPPKLFQVTLYGSSEDAYEQVTGHRVFKRILNNIIAIKEANIPLLLTITPNKYMKNDIRKIIVLAISLGIPFNINSGLITPRSNTGRQLEDLPLEEYIKIYRTRTELNNEKLVAIEPTKMPVESCAGTVKYGLQCGGGRSTFVIKYDGRMSPCPSLPEISTNPLETDFISAWNDMKDLVDSYPMPQECEGCAYSLYCIRCPAIHNNAKKTGHCDPKICARTKKLIQEGFIKLK